MSFLLDTNAYFRLFQNRKSPDYDHLAYDRLIKRIKGEEDVVSFYISEITSLEIHSVLGKYGRGMSSQHLPCTRKIIVAQEERSCSNIWVSHGRRKMRRKVFRDIQKLIFDTEAMRGIFQATILELDTIALHEARNLLSGYSHRYNFGSHDALIAGSLIAVKQVKKIDLTLVTSDKGFKAMLREKGIPVFDPRKVVPEKSR